MTDDELKRRLASQRRRGATYRARHLEQERARGRAYSKKHHAAHRAESIAASKAYYAAHRVEQLALRKAKWALRSEADQAKDNDRRLKYRKRDNDKRRLRRAENPEAARKKESERRAAPGYSERAVARTAEWARQHPEQHRALMRKVDAKRRALEQGVFVEAIDPRVVFERDKGQCGICREPVDPMSPWEVDHIIPIAKRGDHSYVNVQLAHRRCNRKKAAR
jgi:5-methylcytosine-specific restriction endonuclease McrA